MTEAHMAGTVWQQLGKTMTSYKIVKQLGSGGMADVFLVVAGSATGLKRLCAMKTVRDIDHFSDELNAMFAEEMRLTLTLSHANIVKIIDVTAYEGVPALVMEYIPGLDVRRLMDYYAGLEARVPLELILFIGAESAKGLDYLHHAHDSMSGTALKIIHRDISPSNILVSVDGEVKITDFGVAKAADSHNKTRAGLVKGKYSYMSPEQILNRDIDQRSDIYSLGVVLWEMITSQRMFTADNDANLAEAVARGNPYASIKDVVPTLDNELAAIIDKATAISASGRYSTAGEMSNALLRHLMGKNQGFAASKVATVIRKLCQTEIEAIQRLLKTDEAAVSAAGNSVGLNSVKNTPTLPKGQIANATSKGGNVVAAKADPAALAAATEGNAERVVRDSGALRSATNSDLPSLAESLTKQVHTGGGDQFKLERGVDLTYTGGATELNSVWSRGISKADNRIVPAASWPRAAATGSRLKSVQTAPKQSRAPKSSPMLIALGILIIGMGLVYFSLRHHTWAH